MKTLKINGIIIFKRDFGESDRIFHIFTEHIGKIEVIAKNVRNGSRRAGHLELFNFGTFFLYKSKNHYYLNQCETIHEFTQLKKDLDSIGAAYLAIELLNKLMPLEDPNQELFRETALFLKYLELTLKKDLTLLTFKIKLMTELGLLPEIMECSGCKNRLAPDLTYFPNEHRYYCRGCTSNEGTLVSTNSIKLFYYLKKVDFGKALTLKSDKNLEKAIAELTTLTDLYLQEHLGS
ncbi:MAG: DNA repair protein RecO [Patescibacteria group bacterium]|nr:DNA repair protein RecO [Patescibacteria group bacterium]